MTIIRVYYFFVRVRVDRRTQGWNSVNGRDISQFAMLLRQDVDRVLEKTEPGVPRPWLYGLDLHREETCLLVTFPHALYARFFAPHKAAFETALAVCQPELTDIHYLVDMPSGVVPRQDAPAPAEADQSQTSLSQRAAQPVMEADGPELETFLCNAKNAFPLAAVQRIATSAPGAAYSPLVLYGRSGTGKTHLLQALTRQLLRRHWRVQTAPAARFCRHAAAWAQHPELFWQHYDALLLDDMQDILEEAEWQHRLLLLLDSCPPDRQCVLALSGTARQLRQLAPRLLGRLETGLVTELLEPDLDVRLRYLQDFCRHHELTLPRDDQLFLARQCPQFRLLQGMLRKVRAFATLKKAALTRMDLENIARTGGTRPTAGHREILEEVARHYALPPEEMLGTGRRPQLVLARQIAMYLCRRRLGLSYPELGRVFGGRDHSTVIHAIKKIRKMLVSNKDVQLLVTRLERNMP